MESSLSRKITVFLWDAKGIKERCILDKKYSGEEYERETKQFVAKWCNKRGLLDEEELFIGLHAAGNEELNISTIIVKIPELYKELCQYLKDFNQRKNK